MRMFRKVEDVAEFNYFKENMFSASTQEVFGEGTEISDEDTSRLWEVGAIVLHAFYYDNNPAGYTLTLLSVDPCTQESTATIVSIFIKKEYRSLENLSYLFDNTIEEVSKGMYRVSISVPSDSRLSNYFLRKGMDSYMTVYSKVVGE